MKGIRGEWASNGLGVCLAVMLIAGCGGGGGSTPQTVSGVAASGLPMTGNAYLKDAANDPELSTSIDSQSGRFSFNVTGKEAPYLLRAGTLYSMGSGPGTANINPLTTLMVAEAGGFSNMSSMNSFYRDPDRSRMTTMFRNLSSARQHMRLKMGPMLSNYGVANSDPLTAPMTIGQGMDRMFDDIKMTVDANGNVTMMYQNGTTLYTGPMSSMSSGTMASGNLTSPGTVTGAGFTVSPSMARLTPGATQQFTATTPVTWSVATASSGTISATGLYTAPATSGMYLVRATSMADPTKSTTTMVLVGNSGMMM
jgi:hypothetical protein